MNPKTSPFLFLQQQQSQQSSSLPSLGPSPQLRCLTKFSFVPNSHPTFVSLLKNRLRLHGSSSSGDGTPASCRCRTTTIVTHDLMRFSCVQCKQANGHQSQSLRFRTKVNLRVNAPLKSNCLYLQRRDGFRKQLFVPLA